MSSDLDSTPGVTTIQLDVTDSASLVAAATKVTEWAGPAGLDCLVNNAAVLVFGEAAWQTPHQVGSQQFSGLP